MSIIHPSSLLVTSDCAHRLQRHVEYLASPDLEGRKPGTQGHEAAAQYIIHHLEQSGVEPLPSLMSYRQRISPEIGDNVIGVRRAQSPSPIERWLLLGAHYDHLGISGGQIYAGADDNGGAVAILLEVAKSLPPLQHYSIAFVAFNAEEPPYMLMGSQFFMDHLPDEINRAENFQAIVIMELMGGVHWSPLQQTVFAAGAEHSPGLYRHVKNCEVLKQDGQELHMKPLGLHCIEEIPILGRTPFSDYDAFRNASVPFLFLSAGRTPRYHQPTDLPDTLHYERMALTTQWLQNLFHQIDEDHQPYEFFPNALAFTDDVNTLQPLISLAGNPQTCIPKTSLASRLKLQADEKWLNSLNLDKAGSNDISRLERASLRIQGLLADFPASFLL